MLAQLDKARVSAKGTATLSKTAKGFKAYLGYLVLFMTAFSSVLAIESEPKASYEWVAVALIIVTCVPIAVTAALGTLALDISYLLATDAAYQVAADIQHVTGAAADYDGFATRVYRVHTGTVALSQKMTPSLFGYAGFMFLTVLVFLFVAVGPRPDRGDEWHGMGNWYNFFFHEYVAAVNATSFAAQLVWGLAGPARVTSACQKVASAANDLRVKAGADGTVTLATAEQLHRIEGLSRYINELNKNQGLGFLVLRKRITFTLVMGLLIQTVSAMLVINTALMSIVTVDGDGWTICSKT